MIPPSGESKFTINCKIELKESNITIEGPSRTIGEVMEIPFVSGKFDYGPINFVLKPILFPSESTEGRLALSELMMKYWANIAKYGDPNAFTDGPKWEKFTKKKQQYLTLDNPIDNKLNMVEEPVDIDLLLTEVESNSSLEIAERCVIGWIAANDTNELKQAHSLDQLQDPPYNFCSNFENEYLYIQNPSKVATRKPLKTVGKTPHNGATVQIP